MLNKKILAASIAASLTAGAHAVDLNAGTGTVYVAAETVAAADLNGTDGLVELTGAPLAVTMNAGFSIANGTSKYVRVDLTNGKFSAITSLDDDVAVPDNTAVTIPSAGGVGQSFAIFELAADVGDITASEDLTLTAEYRVTNNAALGITYKLFETAQDAIDNDAAGLASATGTVATITRALTGTFSTAASAEAKVATQFKNFDGATLPGDSDADLNVIDDADLVGSVPAGAAGWTFPDTTTAFGAGDLVTGAATLTFDGDFSFGTFAYGANTWSLDSDGDYVVAGATENTDGTFSVSYADGTFSVDTIDTDGAQDSALKGSYEVTLAGVTTGVASPVNAVPSFTEASGTITYDTTSIEVPYITTFADYNQRIYIVNNSSADAEYTMSFTSEEAVTSATPLAAASGTVKGNSVLMIRAMDVVELEGRQRTSAVIEVEGTDAAISATTQIVDADGGTDTVILN